MGYFLCKQNDFWQDSWTYGDWRQYMCRRKDGALQAAKLSALTTISAVIGFCIMVLCAMAVYFFYAHDVPVYWERLGAFWIAGGLMIMPVIMERNYGLYLMVSVGPKQYTDRRILPGEESE